MKSRYSVSTFLALMFSLGALSASTPQQYWAFSELAPVGLCSAVTNLLPGDKIPVVVQGIYYAGVLFDLKHSCCGGGLDSRVCVRFTAEAEKSRNFREFIELARDPDGPPLIVAFEGLLEAHPLPKRTSFDPRMPLKLRAAVRSGDAALPECGFYEYALRVYRIRSFDPGHGQPPSSLGCGKQPTEVAPLRLDVPGYPKFALLLSYEGNVLVLLSVQNGKVVGAKLQFGDALLAGEALANARSWQFSEDVNQEFTVRYRFRLEQRDEGTNTNLRYELNLPYEVSVFAPLGPMR